MCSSRHEHLLNETSILLSRSLDVLGYSSWMIDRRRKITHEIEGKYNVLGPGHIEIHIHGQLADGIAKEDESVVKCRIIPTDIVCVDSVELVDMSDTRGKTVLVTDRSNSPPGYVSLRLLSFENGDHSRTIRKITFGEKEVVWSSLFLRHFEEMYPCIRGEAYHPDIGKRTRLSYGIQYMRSGGHLHTRRWTRSQEVVLIPRGSDRSDRSFLEWEIRYVTAEREKTNAMNMVQLKLLCLLRYIRKIILQQTSTNITSYAMKNVVFFLTDRLPENTFQDEKLLQLLVTSIKWLETCVQDGHLPHYFIPERNLLTETTRQPYHKEKLLACLQNVHREKMAGLLRFQRLSKTLYMTQYYSQNLNTWMAGRDKTETDRMTMKKERFVGKVFAESEMRSFGAFHVPLPF